MGRRSHLPLSLYTSSPFIQLQTKTGGTLWMPPVKNRSEMTSYGGITRIRLKGRSSSTSSQPAAQAPLYLFVGHIIHRWPILCNGSSAQNQMLILVNMPDPGIPGGPLQCPPAGLPGGGRGGQYCKCYKNWGNSRLICSQNDGKIETCICRRGICTKTKRRKQT